VLVRIAFITLTVLAMATAARAAERTGQQIYKDDCARCHGDQGQGVLEEYGKPLVGDRSVSELTKLIAKTMPSDDPGSCSPENAAKVADYIHTAFYSPVAQARNKPARIELSRLTVRQFRNSLADLIGSFRWNNVWLTDQLGLKGVYYDSRTFDKKRRVIERIDAGVNFDFDTDSPEPETIPYDNFSIQWEGSLLAPETGEYEIIVRCENGMRLWLNGFEKPLIDGSVHSGTDVELREPIYLLGGRAYPIKLEIWKSREAKEKNSSVSLRWRVPQRGDELIPTRNLSPRPFPVVHVVKTQFPPDDRSAGYERATSISKAWDQATTNAAFDTANYVVANLRDLSGVNEKDGKRIEKLKDFCYKWTSRAFRRPLTDDQKQFFVDRVFAASPDVETSVKRVVLLTLLSPRFLYHQAVEKPDQFDVASRLSFALWDSIPDQTLLEVAEKGKLSDPAEVRRHAERMIGDARARQKLHEFFVQWVRADQFPDLAKDSKRFPEFDEQTITDLRASLDLFLDDVALDPKSDFRQLLLADWLELNGRLAKFYGANLPEDAPFQRVKLDEGQRSGVLTHPYLMAGFAYTDSSSPIHRGVFVARSVLGRALRPPPEAVAPLPIELHASLTTRERISLQTKEQSCQSCHRMINPLGFAFENFDAVGRYRKAEQGKKIDATGLYLTRSGDAVKFKNVRELATFLADNEETHAAFVERLFHFMIKQPIRAFGPHEQSNLESAFEKSRYNIRTLAIEIAASAAMGGEPVTQLSDNER
jgi:hypothetical protein